MENAIFTAKYIWLALSYGDMKLDDNKVLIPNDDNGDDGEHTHENWMFNEGLKYLADSGFIVYEESRERSRVMSYTVTACEPFFGDFIKEYDIAPTQDKNFREVRLKFTEDYIDLLFDGTRTRIKNFQLEKPIPMMLSYAANNHERERVTYLEMQEKNKRLKSRYIKGIKNEIMKDSKLKVLCDYSFISFPSNDSIKVRSSELMPRTRLNAFVANFPEKSQK